MEVEGKIKVIGKEETFGSKGFRKRLLVITTDEQYPQHLPIDFTQDKCDLLDKFTDGDSVLVKINLRGREWVNPEGEAKYFGSIQGWSIAKVGSNAVASSGNKLTPSLKSEEGKDGLPF